VLGGKIRKAPEAEAAPETPAVDVAVEGT
jgi:hypothetical protein